MAHSQKGFHFQVCLGSHPEHKNDLHKIEPLGNNYKHSASLCVSTYSTQDVLLHVTDKWLRAVDEGEYTGAVFLDLAKSFDTVDHSISCTTDLLWL